MLNLPIAEWQLQHIADTGMVLAPAAVDMAHEIMTWRQLCERPEEIVQVGDVALRMAAEDGMVTAPTAIALAKELLGWRAYLEGPHFQRRRLGTSLVSSPCPL